MSEDSVFLWKLVIDGVDEFKGGKFIVHMDMTEFPFKHPKIEFKTKVYHPNVGEDGKICERALEAGWSPMKTAIDVIDFILSTFRNPAAEEPINEKVGAEFRDNRKKWSATAAEWTQLYAK